MFSGSISAERIKKCWRDSGINSTAEVVDKNRQIGVQCIRNYTHWEDTSIYSLGEEMHYYLFGH